MDIKREDFTVDGTRLVLEDRIDTYHPWLSERILWIADTNAFYSAAPLCPARHELLCFNYCEDALKERKPDPFLHALVLGCGGGAIPRWLLEEYPTLTVDVVDRSEKIISICKEYFLQRWENCDRLKYYCVDAKDFEPEYQYQFIFCDLFDGQDLAPVVSDPAFAKKLRGMITDNGFVVINCGWGSPYKIKEIYRSDFGVFQVILRGRWQTQVLIVSP